jgi:hypothetical protein
VHLLSQAAAAAAAGGDFVSQLAVKIALQAFY